MTNREVYFKQKVRYWFDKFGYKDWTIIVNEKMWHSMGVFPKTKELVYNPKYLCVPNSTLMLAIFHEIGHIYGNNFPNSYDYDKELNKIISEYLAEKRAFYWLKKYYPSYYKQELKVLKNRMTEILTYPKSQSHYFLAYSQIPEFNKLIEIEG